MKQARPRSSVLWQQQVSERREGRPLSERFRALGALFCWGKRPFRQQRHWRRIVQTPDLITGIEADDRLGRLRLVESLLCLAGLVVLGRVYLLQTEQSPRWERLAERQHEVKIEIQGARGTLRDSGGHPLAVSVEALAVGAHPRQMTRRSEAAQTLAPLVGKSAAEIERKLAEDRSFVWLGRGVDRAAQPVLAQVEGIELFKEFRRDYPQGEIGAVLLGKVSAEGRGLAGMELAFEHELSAPSEVLAVRRDARGRFFGASFMPASLGELLLPVAAARPLRESPFRPEGGAIDLTLNIALQEVLEQEFTAGRKDAEAARVFGVLLDAENGEILALAQSVHPDRLRANPLESMRIIGVQDSFEPGSVFKPLVAALALDEKVLSTRELIDCENGRFQVAGHVIGDVHPVPLVPFPEVLIRSSNIGIAKIGLRLGKEKLPPLLFRLGFGQRSGIELSGEARGIIKPAGEWATIDAVTASFGQGVSVTALQLVRAYAALANGGRLVEPHLLKGARTEERQVLRPQTAQEIASILVGVTQHEEGTGKLAALSGVEVGGKTGTAQKPRRDGRGYDPENVLSSFIGFVDGRTIGAGRRLVLLVAVDEPTVRPRWGGVVAAPIFRRSMERILSYLLSHDTLIRTAEDERTPFAG